MNQTKIVSVLALTILLTGCPLEGDDGAVGIQGPTGEQGLAGTAGINCWDLNEDGIDDPNEDINQDGIWGVEDCGISSVGEQHPDAQYNFQHFCEAFANLGQYPQGCPSDTHVTPSGVLTAMIPAQFDGSYNTCSDLSVSIDNEFAYWSLDNGFIASSQVLDISEREQCKAACESDSRCVASEWQLRAGTGAGDCQIYYHSDSLTKPYKRLCGVDIASSGISAPEVCLTSLASDTVWHAKCP